LPLGLVNAIAPNGALITRRAGALVEFLIVIETNFDVAPTHP